VQSPENKQTSEPTNPTQPVLPNDKQSTDVIGNKRLTALVSAILLVLLLAQVLSVPNLRPLLALHILVGMVLLGPLVLKLCSTGYKFMCYYTHSPAFVREGPPRLWLRLLAPLLVSSTLIVFGSGIGLLFTTPSQLNPLRPIHIISFVVWLPLLVVHLFAHLPEVPTLIGDDWRKPTTPAPGMVISGNKLRLVVSLSALLLGVRAAILSFPLTGEWLKWFETNETGPGPFIASLVFSLLALLATRPLRKGKN
jgi:hypothetical protein